MPDQTKLPPFQPHLDGRLQQIEETPYLDASELVWSGVLDKAADLGGWPWVDLRDRTVDLFERGWIPEALHVVSYAAQRINDTRAELTVQFGVTHTMDLSSAPASWEQTFTLTASRTPIPGKRWWFVCGCGHRRWRLYRPDLGFWRCRECCQLTYKSRQEHNRASRHGKGWRRLIHYWDMSDARGARIERRQLRGSISRAQ